MELERTPLYLEIIDVLKRCDKNSQVAWKAIIHLDANGKIYETLKVSSITIRRDYVDAFADEMTATISIPLGKYAKQIYPNRSTLQISLLKIPLLENSTVWDMEKEIKTERFSALLVEEGPAITQLQGMENKDEWALDLVDILEVKFQLFNKANERLRISTIGGIYRKAKMEDVMLQAITSITNKIKVDNTKAIKGVDLVPVNNTQVKEQVILNHGLRLIDLPGFLQNRFGVYSSGLGSYIQNRSWYIYPLYDTSRFKKSLRTLNIYVLPRKKFPEIERTYFVKGTAVSLLSTTNTDFRGDNDTNQINDGNGVRFTEASNVMESFNETSNNRTIVKRQFNNNEFASVNVPDGLDFAPVSDNNRITANPFVHYTDLALRKGGVFRLNWENSDPRLIEPGMVTRIVYFDKSIIKEAYGVVLAAIHMTVKVGDMNMLKHSSNSQITLFTNLKTSTQ